MPNSVLVEFHEAADVAEVLEQALPSTFEDYVRALEQGGLTTPASATWLDDPYAGKLPFDDSGDVLALLPYQRALACQSWQNAKRETLDYANALGTFRSRIAPPRFYWLLGVMVALLLLCTVAPMTSLSARGGDGKTLLLTFFAILSAAFFGFIGDELRRLRNAGDLTKETF